MGNTEIIGIGVVAVTLFTTFTGVILKITADHRAAYQSLSNKVIEVVEKNADAFSTFTSAIHENTKATEKSSDNFNQLLKELLRNKS